MKILFYNLGYGRGIDGSLVSYCKHLHRFIYQSAGSQKKVIDAAAEIVVKEKPDVFAYAEVGLGATRTGNFNQHSHLVSSMVNTVESSAATKYGESLFSKLPFHAGNGNGLISFQSAEIEPLYLRNSRKKLVYVCKLEAVTVFVVHLPLISSDRALQLKELSSLVNQTSGDVVVCGDFNIFNGFDELAYLKEKSLLQNIPEPMKTYPSHKPKIQLDVFLYRFANDSFMPKQRTIDSVCSDHLPIVLEW